LIGNARPFPLMVDRRHFNPAKRMVDEIASGDLDAGVLWGPIGGFYAKKARVPITVRSLAHENSRPRMTYRITFGVRPTEKEWKRQLNRLIRKKQTAINKILLDFGVPILDEDDNLITAAGTGN
ncbi:MAG: substrate-binding domain-containing protein, partial [Boseongicola sp.]